MTNNLRLDNIDIKLEIGNLLLNILYLRFSPPNSIKNVPNHCHSTYELHYIPYGEGKLIVNGVTYILTPGTMYLTGPNIYHEQKTNESNPMAEYCINFEVLPNYIINQHISKCDKYPGKDIKYLEKVLVNTVFWFGFDKYNSIELFKRLSQEINNKYLGYYLNIKQYISIIITNTVRCYLDDPKSLDVPPEKDINDKRRLIIDLYIENDWANRSVTELAKLLGVSVRQLNRIFLKYYGMPFNNKLTQIRMENASKMLTESDLSVNTIAEQIGFSDFGYFCRIFKKHYSITALEYRKRFNNSMNNKLLKNI